MRVNIEKVKVPVAKVRVNIEKSESYCGESDSEYEKVRVNTKK